MILNSYVNVKYPVIHFAVVKMNLAEIRTPPQKEWSEDPSISIPTADGKSRAEASSPLLILVETALAAVNSKLNTIITFIIHQHLKMN